jgi:dolichol kinase
MLLDIVDFLNTYFLLRRYTIPFLERIVLSVLLINLEYKFTNPLLSILSRLYLIDMDLFICMISELDIRIPFRLVKNNIEQVTYTGFLVFVMVLIQYFVLRKKTSNIRQRININRKIFHILLLILYYNPTNFLKMISEYSMLAIMLTTRSEKFKSTFNLFLSARDGKNLLVSHMYLLLSCVAPIYYLNLKDYRANLVSVCILDTTSSVVGIYSKKTRKSLIGTLSGIISSLTFYYLIEKDFLPYYFTIIGLVEYSDICNDNLSIPVTSVIYFNLKKLP